MPIDARLAATFNVMGQICKGLFYLHSNTFMHRDLKPENILCFKHKDGRYDFKLADFGFTKQKVVDTNTLGVGTKFYCDPLICMGNGQGQYGFEVDLFSLGAIMYLLLECRYPWTDQNLTGADDPVAITNWTQYNVLPF